MNRRHCTRLLPGAALCGTGLAADSGPSIVLLLTDVQRRDSLGCYGNTEIRTPHADRLARDGVLFGQATVTGAICTSSRACYFFGQCERHHGINFDSGTANASTSM